MKRHERLADDESMSQSSTSCVSGYRGCALYFFTSYGSISVRKDVDVLGWGLSLLGRTLLSGMSLKPATFEIASQRLAPRGCHHANVTC